MRRIFLSPAKINLFLKVLKKRNDGYHEILSMVDLVSLYDIILIEPKERGEIVLEAKEGEMPKKEDNLIYRAVILLREQFGIKDGVAIYVKKRIPIGSGLGGGSSNAATVLLALSEIFNLGLKKNELYELGLRLGADVPLFIYRNPCIVKGIGEIIEPVNIPRIWYVIVYPGIPVSTAEVYSSVQIRSRRKELDIGVKRSFSSLEDLIPLMENDLEEPAKRFVPQIKEVRDMLRRYGAKIALMTGSGSSVFGCFERKMDAILASKKLVNVGRVFVVRSIRRRNKGAMGEYISGRNGKL